MKIHYFNVNNIAMVFIQVDGYEVRASRLTIEIRNYNTPRPMSAPFKRFTPTSSTPAFRNAMNAIDQLRKDGEIK